MNNPGDTKADHREQVPLQRKWQDDREFLIELPVVRGELGGGLRIQPWPTSTIVGVILVSLCHVGPVAGKCPIVFEAHPVKDTILPFEKAFIWLRGYNDGDTAAFINSLSFFHITVVAVSLDSGDTLRCPTGDGCWGGPDTSSDRHLSPGQTHVGYDLLIGPRFEHMQQAVDTRDPRTGFTPWPKGRIQAELQFQHNPWEVSRDAPCSMIVDTVVFEVVEESVQDVGALDAIGRARSWNDPNTRMDSLWSVILKYAGSPYASLAADEIVMQLNRLGLRPLQPSVSKLCTELARNYPLDGNVGVAIVGLLGKLRPRARRPIIADILSSLPDPPGIRRLLKINFDEFGRWRGTRKR